MSRIVKPRADGRVHFADCELGDLFYQDGEWWVVAMLGEWDDDVGPDDVQRRTGGSRPATIADAVGILSDIDARLTRIERQTQHEFLRRLTS